MKFNYEQILIDMKTAFFEECGKNAENLPEIDARFKNLATELYAISSYGEYIMKQAFIQTASGSYLDMHAAERGLVRKNGSKARGDLTFSIESPQEADVLIPKGTVCSVKGMPFIQFITTEDAEILVGQSSVNAAAQALEDGSAYNTGAKTITVMVNAPTGVSSVCNDKKFISGCNSENDETFRQRMMAHYSTPLNGVNAQSIEEVILLIDGVIDCVVAMGESQLLVRLYIKTQTNSLEDDVIEKIVDAMALVYIIEGDLDIVMAQEKTFPIVCEVKVMPGYDAKEVKSAFETAITEYCSAERIGVEISLSRLSASLSHIEGARDFSVYSSDQINNIIPCSKDKYLSLSPLEVNVYA